MDFPTCGTCPHWSARDDIKATVNTAGVIARAAPDTRDIVVGECFGQPPQTLMVPTQTLKGQGITPQPFERFTQASRPCCALHPDTPSNRLQREYQEAAKSYMAEASKYQQRAMQIAEQAEADRKRFLEGVPDFPIAIINGGGSA